ncbi:SDR family oxidoreductase [Vibrio sp. S9_S30]|uniref:SDR family NAD(P)-dependent oxidoreductase n=1 Tax=Vibrio sp. S9_S30 TaxID=2720226 RepID=UPI0016808FE3|nr:SDR family oxidoreductase [Vibrio sp. S9_S30]MBD1558712.1 SDR family oxidoreductase [Vibrio sp. S9_S30]
MKTALITGGSKGIGLEMVRRLLDQGFQVITCSRNKSGWDESIRQYPILEAVDYHVTDISDEAALKMLFGHVAQRYGKLDIAVNNASPAIGSLGQFHTVDSEKLKDTLNHDFWAQALCLQSELNLMSEGAAIVNVSSINGLRPTPNASMYSAAKHAIEGLTRSLAIENIERGIRINAVAPGVTWTPRWEERAKTDPNIRESVSQAVPMKRFAKTKEVADAIEFLLSDKASYVVGHTLVVDGGMTLS